MISTLHITACMYTHTYILTPLVGTKAYGESTSLVAVSPAIVHVGLRVGGYQRIQIECPLPSGRHGNLLTWQYPRGCHGDMLTQQCP